MDSRAYLVCTCVGAALIAGFVLGRSTSTRPAAPGSGEAARGDRSSIAPESQKTTPALEREHAPSITGSENSLAGRLFEAARQRDYFRRTHDVVEIADALDAKGIAEAMDAVQRFPEQDRAWSQFALISRWVELDSGAAAAWVEKLPSGERRDSLWTEIFHSLGLKNPTEALQLLSEVNDPRESQLSYYLNRVFDGWAQREPEPALRAAMELPTEDERSTATSAVVGTWSRSDPRSALAWAHTVPEARQRRQWLQTVLRTWAERDPAAAVDYALAMAAGQERDAALRSLVSAVAVSDPEATARVLAEIPEGKARMNAVRAVISSLDDINPQLAAEYVLALPPRRQSESLHQVAGSLGRQDPHAALEWAARLGTAEIRLRAQERIVQEWAEEEPLAAAEYAMQNFPPDSNGFTSTLRAAARARPEETMRWLQRLPPGPAREAALPTAIAGLAEQNPRKAAESAVTLLKDPEGRRQTFTNIGYTWAETEPAAAADWAVQLPDREGAAEALKSITSRWATDDSTSAAAWLETLPTGSSRDAAVASFAQVVSSDDPHAAMAWAAHITNPQSRETTIDRVVSIWLNEDQAGAAEWLRGASPELQRRFAHRLAR